jgi:hypothetical protein
MKGYQQIAEDEFFNLTYPNGLLLTIENINRCESNLIENIEGAIEKLRTVNLARDELNSLSNNFIAESIEIGSILTF